MSTGRDLVMETKSELFCGTRDRYRGVTVLSAKEPCADRQQLAVRLQRSLDQWKQEGVRGVWFHMGVCDSDWVPVLANHGFEFHHVHEGLVVMIKWLPEKETNQIPPYAHHMVGVGSIVVNDRDEILVVQEKYTLLSEWKLPGGYVDPGEDIPDAAVREVKEETGIDTTFKSVVAFRQSHKFNYGCSDLYIIVHLVPTSSEIRACSRELTKCQWMALEEFIEHDKVNDTNKLFTEKFLEGRRLGLSLTRTYLDRQIKNFLFKQQIYSIDKKQDVKDGCILDSSK